MVKSYFNTIRLNMKTLTTFFMTLVENYLYYKRRINLQVQLGQMECGGGVSFWPKPILHSTLVLEYANFILVKPYGVCNRGYHCNEITMVSCKHIYHLFCLSKVLRNTNKCLVCSELLHHDWWTN
jgi:hypothetical protein